MPSRYLELPLSPYFIDLGIPTNSESSSRPKALHSVRYLEVCGRLDAAATTTDAVRRRYTCPWQR